MPVCLIKKVQKTPGPQRQHCTTTTLKKIGGTKQTEIDAAKAMEEDLNKVSAWRGPALEDKHACGSNGVLAIEENGGLNPLNESCG